MDGRSRDADIDGSAVAAVDVHYGGQVQGVGFRWRTSRVATRHAVTGWVRNLADGRVQLVAEGAPAALDAFLDDVRRELARFIRDEASTEREATGAFTGFRIRS